MRVPWFLEPTSCAQPPECGISCLHCGVVELPTVEEKMAPSNTASYKPRFYCRLFNLIIEQGGG